LLPDRRALGALLVCAASLPGCKAPDPKAELAVSNVETYWAIDAPKGQTQYIAPAVKLTVTNKGQKTWSSIVAAATFRRKGEADSWGGDSAIVASSKKPLGPGQSTTVLMSSDGRYYSEGTPESMFAHALFKDATVEVFLRVGPSEFAKFAQADVERRVGSRSVGVDLR
jgi:hypothetical protein